MDEILKLLSVMTGDQRFSEGWKAAVKRAGGRKEDDNMGEKWIDEIEKRGEKRGEERGEKRGEKIGEKRGIEKGRIMAYYDSGLSIEAIAEKVQTSIERVKNVLNLSPVKNEA